MAKAVVEGIEAAGGEARLIQVPETLSDAVLAKMYAPAKDKSVPTISLDNSDGNGISLEDALVNCDGILFGYPTRFGGMPAQVKAIWDATGGFWRSGSLIGKPISVFFSTAVQNGGFVNENNNIDLTFHYFFQTRDNCIDFVD